MAAARIVILAMLAVPFAAEAAAGQSQFTRRAQRERQSDREYRFENLDTNRNGRIERAEWQDSADAFEWLDRNDDNVLSRAEVMGRRPPRTGNAVPRSAGTSGTANAQDCTQNAAKIVDDVYQQVLERPADQASAGMTQALANGTMTVREIVAQVSKSPEHAQRFFWEPVVATIYRQMLQRSPNDQELREMAAALASGQRQLPEVIARTAARASNNPEDAVRILYRRLLGREADPQGLRDFTDLARRQGIEVVARDIVASPEYQQRAAGLQGEDLAAYETAVRSLYRHVLGREPDQLGLRDLTQVALAQGFDAVVDRMVSSPEYDRLFGENAVPGRGTRYCGATP